MPFSKQESLPLTVDHPAAKVLAVLGFEILEGSDWHAPHGKAAKITPSGQIEFCFTNPDVGIFLRSGPFAVSDAANVYDLLSTTFLYLGPRRATS
jgi:hypothetical protein